MVGGSIRWITVQGALYTFRGQKSLIAVTFFYLLIWQEIFLFHIPILQIGQGKHEALSSDILALSPKRAMRCGSNTLDFEATIYFSFTHFPVQPQVAEIVKS